MRKSLFLAVAVSVVAALPARVEAGVFFTDSFDTYVTGSNIAGQGGWETWDNNPGADTTVVSTQAFNPPNSLFVANTADIVHQFAGVTSGTWSARAMVYIPSTQEGETWFILLNTYVPGVHNTPDWSVQVVFCNINCLGNGIPGTVLSLGGGEVGGGGSIPLILDEWVEIRAEIDLTNNQYQLFYGGQLFETQQWILTNPLRLQAVDLFSNGSTESYMDYVWLDATACEASVRVKGDVHSPGSTLPVGIHIAHNRPETVTVPWELSLIDPRGQVVAQRVTPPHTFEQGDVVDVKLALPLPEDLEGGTYTLRLRISGMAGTKGATTRFRVGRAE